MTDWMYWLAGAGVLVIMELLTGTFYLLMIAIGLGVGAGAALLGLGAHWQTLVAAVVGVVATGLLHRSRLGRPVKRDAARDPNVNLDIGQSLQVDDWRADKARVSYRGALWDVQLGPGAHALPGRFKIVEIQGCQLIVANA